MIRKPCSACGEECDDGRREWTLDRNDGKGLRRFCRPCWLELRHGVIPKGMTNSNVPARPPVRDGGVR